MVKYIEQKEYTSKALFKDLFSQEKKDLHVKLDLRLSKGKSSSKKEEPINSIAQPVSAVKKVKHVVKVVKVVKTEKPKRMPYTGEGPKAYHISKNKETGLWQIKASGDDNIIITFEDFERMVGFSKVLADKNGATVRLHDEKGSISTLY